MGIISNGLNSVLNRIGRRIRALGRWIARGEQKAPVCNT